MPEQYAAISIKWFDVYSNLVFVKSSTFANPVFTLTILLDNTYHPINNQLYVGYPYYYLLHVFIMSV